ncbi:Chloroplast stem-loop binding protein of 41 kDa a, chloroplastic [Coccomyxa sp. Obi]|nr:Chloroplast stem-loop binding protein of 41 kDa a, chloroplastic [Coccomyxa sp. Obi]
MQTGSSLLSPTRSTRAFTSSAARSHVLRSGSTRQRSPCLLVRAENVLIINTKGGGHAEIGLHLAKQLLSGGHSVTILNDGDQAKLEKKAPFNQYGTLQDAKIVWGNPADPANFPSEKFDVVYDNNGKDMDACQPAIDHFKGSVAHYVFVASAGAYKTNKMEPALVEGDARKESAGHVAVEKYLEEQDLPYTIFQPLYIYGPYTGKDYMRFFLDRLLRNRPVLIPSPGIQLTSLSHVEDVASLLAKVPGNAAAIRQQFNVSSDRYITLDGLIKALAEAAGVEANIVHYDPKAVKLGKGEGFPFRTEHFMAIVDKAKRVLGWAPTHKILDDIPELVEAYKSAGYLDADVDFSVDDKILEAVGHKVPALA